MLTVLDFKKFHIYKLSFHQLSHFNFFQSILLLPEFLYPNLIQFRIVIYCTINDIFFFIKFVYPLLFNLSIDNNDYKNKIILLGV